MQGLWPPRPADVWVVHDDPVRAAALRSMLAGGCAHEVTACEDPTVALERLERGGLDLLLVGATSPAGPLAIVEEAIWRIPVGDHVPVVALMPGDEAGLRTTAFALGATDVITEPVDDEELCHRIRTHLSGRLTVATLHHHVQGLEQRLEESERASDRQAVAHLRQLHATLGLRWPEAAAHGERVGRAAAALARTVGQSQAAARRLELAASVHDLGMLAVPDAIRDKPGPLTADERRTMERHPVLGARLLGSVTEPLVELAAAIALSHHERWDGQGYPFGIAGERIPLAARITAVVAVFDALVHERPYRAAWPVDAAIDELRRLAGTHLDPRLVRAFVGGQVARAPMGPPELDPISLILEPDADVAVNR